MCSDVLSLDVCLSKCVSYVVRCAFARRLSIKMRFLCVQMCSRSTPVYPNAFPMLSVVLSLDACRSKCVSYVFRCALARRPPIKMRFPCVQKLWEGAPGFENGLIRIWTRSCPNEAIWKQICQSFRIKKSHTPSSPSFSAVFPSATRQRLIHQIHSFNF